MTTYVKITDFASKDALLTGNPAKIVKGVEIDDEFNAIATADATSVKGPIGVTVDNTVVRWDGTTGRAVQGSGVTISDADVVTASGFTGPHNGTVGATTPSTGAFTTLSASGDVTLSNAAAVIKSNTSDGSDGSLIGITGGGGLSESRGAYIQVAGNENTFNGTGGDIQVNGGSIAGAKIKFRTAGTNVGDFSSTGLAVIGALSATGNVNTSDAFTYSWGAGTAYVQGSSAAGYVKLATAGGSATLDTSGTLNVGWNGASGGKLIVGGVTRSAQQGLRNSLAFSVDNTAGAPSWSQKNLVGHYYTGGQDAISLRVPSAGSANTGSYDIFSDGTHKWYGAAASTDSGSSGTAPMALDTSGNLLVGAVTASARLTIKKSGATEGDYLAFFDNGTNGATYIFGASGTGENGAACAVGVKKNTTTSRSINAAGTINASGADYAEYENNNGLKFTKGDLVGFKADGTLTQSFAESVRFGIKSTNPSYVGGDTWGSEDVVGKRPEQPQFVPPEYTGSQDPGAAPVAPTAPQPAPIEPAALEDEATELQRYVYEQQLAQYQQAMQAHLQAAEQFEQALAAYAQALVAHESAVHIFNMDQSEHAARVEVAQNLFNTATMPEYKRALAAFEAALDAERQKVDRVAYSGKVPVNVMGAVPGGYIVAVATDDGFIAGRFVPDPDFAQYKKAVGRVNRILPDGRCEVAVMVH